MIAIDTALTGLIDYAGLYPPASLDMAEAVQNYVEYQQGTHARFLGRFVVEMARLHEMRDAAGKAWNKIRLSVVAPVNADWGMISDLIDPGYLIEAIECRTANPGEIEFIARSMPAQIACYFEVPMSPRTPAAVEAFASTGARAKLRMGGVAAEAFPTSEAVVAMLKTLAHHRIPFKATAGLHHPLRSSHPFTPAAGSQTGMMHGFVNLLCAATLIHFQPDTSRASSILKEQDVQAWRIAPESIAWRDLLWSAEELRAVRQTFFTGFGSCSFTEPVHDLEALGWL